MTEWLDSSSTGSHHPPTGAMSIRHVTREIATQPVILWTLLGGKPLKMASIEVCTQWWNAHGPHCNAGKCSAACTCSDLFQSSRLEIEHFKTLKKKGRSSRKQSRTEATNLMPAPESTPDSEVSITHQTLADRFSAEGEDKSRCFCQDESLFNNMVKAGPLDSSFSLFLTFLHHGREGVERRLLWKPHGKLQGKSW